MEKEPYQALYVGVDMALFIGLNPNRVLEKSAFILPKEILRTRKWFTRWSYFKYHKTISLVLCSENS